MPATIVRRRRPRKPASVTRTSNLEAKLNDLVSLLQAQHSQPEQSLQPLLSDCNQLQMASEISTQFTSTSTIDQNLTPLTMASKPTSYTSPSSGNSMTQPSTTPLTSAEHYLRDFRINYLEVFPLIHLPVETRAENIQQERPLLWLSIQAVCAQSPIVQNELGTQFRKILAERVRSASIRHLFLPIQHSVFSRECAN